MMSGMGISLGGLEIATDYLYANPEFYEPDLTEVKATISNKPNKQLKPRVKPVKPKVSRESIISKYSIIQPKLKVTADEVIEDDMVVQDDKDFDFSFDDFDMGDNKQGENEEITDDEAEEQVISDADLINKMLMQQSVGRTSEVYESDNEDDSEDTDGEEIENEMDMDENELDNEMDEDDALLNEMFGDEGDDSDSDDELLAEMFDDEDSDDESESYKEEQDTESVEEKPVNFEVQAPQPQVVTPQPVENAQKVEDSDSYEEDSDIEDDEESDDDLLNDMFDEDDNYEEGETDSYEDEDTDENELTDTDDNDSDLDIDIDEDMENYEESDDDLLAEMFGDDMDDSEYDENEDDSDIEDNEDDPELEDDDPEIEESDSESEMSSLTTSISENQESIEEKSSKQVREINVSNESKVTSESSEGDLQKKLAEAMAEIERLKNISSKPTAKEEDTKDDASDKIENKKDKYMMYAGMSTEKLYSQVKEFMVASNVSKKPVDLSVLYDKFGDANIKKLIHKSYLIKLGKGVTIGR